jgi:hypothetical protein
MDVTLRGIGILELQPGCQAYTLSTSLIAAENIATNFTNYIPTLNINLDKCCIETQELLGSIQMKPLHINNINLDELRHANHKLKHFEKILDDEIHQPLLGPYNSIFDILFGIGTVAAIIILSCSCCARYCCDPILHQTF